MLRGGGGGGGGRGQSGYVHREGLQVGAGGRGGVCADTRLPIDSGHGQISAALLCSKLMPEVFKMSRKLLRSSKVLEERMLGDTGCKILGQQ